MKRITSVFLEVCIKYLHKRSRGPRDITTLNEARQEGTGTVSSHPGKRPASITQVAGKAKGSLDALQKRHLCPRRVSNADFPTYIPTQSLVCIVIETLTFHCRLRELQAIVAKGIFCF
jgi:hypothetical protein